MLKEISFARENHLGTVTLTRPEALNALNLPMIKALQQQLSLWQDDASIHAVVVQATSEKAFCAGGDVRWIYEVGIAKNPEQMQFFWHEYRLNHFIHHFKKPYIVLMNGITMGGGVGISLHGSHPVATEKFIFAMPETGIGLFPDIGASYLLARCPGQLGIYLGLTGNRLSAKEALLADLVKFAIDSTQLGQILPRLQALDLSIDAHQKVTTCLQEFKSITTDAPISAVMEKINHYFSFNTVAEIMLALQKSDDPWALSMFENLEQKSPISLEVTFAAIHKAKQLSMAQCVKMDYSLVGHFMTGHDFYEGIRAALIDKDKSPHWQPASLNQVNAAMVATYFENCQPELPLLMEEA